MLKYFMYKMAIVAFGRCCWFDGEATGGGGGSAWQNLNLYI